MKTQIGGLLKRVFVIDDDSEMRELIQDVLVRHGYNVEAFPTGVEALKKVSGTGGATSPDAVICDVIMPEMDGREVTRRMKSMFPAVPVILITGFGSALSPRDAVRAGASQLLTKPFGLSELIEALKLVA